LQLRSRAIDNGAIAPPGAPAVTAAARPRRSSIPRVAAHRRRKKEDLILLKRVEVPLYALADKLVEDGFLEEWDADDPEKVCEAVAQFLRAYSS